MLMDSKSINGSSNLPLPAKPSIRWDVVSGVKETTIRIGTYIDPTDLRSSMPDETTLKTDDIVVLLRDVSKATCWKSFGWHLTLGYLELSIAFDDNKENRLQALDKLISILKLTSKDGYLVHITYAME